MMYERNSLLSFKKQIRLLKHFVAGTVAILVVEIIACVVASFGVGASESKESHRDHSRYKHADKYVRD
jgi:hypothetical protein